MEVEIVEFYPIERNDEKQTLFGSLHVYLVDIEVDLRGIQVKKRKNSWFFGLPSMVNLDQETKERVRFPVFAFVSREKTDALKKVITAKGKEYITKNYLQSAAFV